jgi:NADH dehydrogenase
VKIYITGGTGFVGRAVVARLVEDGHDLIVPARHPDSPAARKLAGLDRVRLVPGDAQDAMRGCDAVIHLTGIIAENGANTFESAHVRATERAVRAATNAGVKRFIHMSALGTRPNAASRYHQTKWQAEEIVRSSALDYTIFRPSIIYGREDQFVNRFAQIARRSPLLPVIGEGRGAFQPIAVGDVARCFAGALDNSRSLGRAFDLGSIEVLTLCQVLDEILAVMKVARLKCRIPTTLARGMAAVFEFIVPNLLHISPPFTRDQIVMLGECNIGDTRPALELFNIHPVAFRDGIGWLKPLSRKPK